MTLLIDNKCARIWAFDEMIDNNTYYDGLTYNDAKCQMINTFRKVIQYKTNDNIKTDIDGEYYNIISNIKIIYNINLQSELDSIKNMNNRHSIYYMCGWSDHIITIFITKDVDSYKLGIINCGQGINFQGCNNTLCNGIIIFTQVPYIKIKTFLEDYKLYFDSTILKSGLLIYRSFYLLLFDIILDKTEVDFSDITNNNIEFYKLPRQYIGSCFFTNTVSIAYYVHLKKNSNTHQSNIFISYSNWYKTAKYYIKEIMKLEILYISNKNEYKYLNYYNEYKYILDNEYNIDKVEKYTDDLQQYISNIPSINITKVNYDYTITNPHTSLSCTNKANIKDDYGFWQLYDNTSTFEVIYNKCKTIPNYRHIDLVTGLFDFFMKVSLFNNNMELIIPLLILYNFKNTYTFEQTELDSTFWETFKSPYILNLISSTNKFDRNPNVHKEHITICIYILLSNDINQIYKEEVVSEFIYYNASIENYAAIQKDNFEYYNNTIFQYIPIINDYYLNIITILIKDLYNNIGIFPNINDPTHVEQVAYTSYNGEIKFTGSKKLVDTHNTSKYYMYYLWRFKTTTHISQSVNKYNFLLWYIYIYSISCKTIPYVEYVYYEVYGLRYPPLSEQIDTSSNNFIVNKKDNDNYNGNNTLYKQILQIFFNDIEKKLLAYDIKTLILLPEILKLYFIYFYLCYLKGTDKITRIANNKCYTIFNRYAIIYFKDIYRGQFINIINLYMFMYDLQFFNEKRIFIINEKTLISNIEKKFFTMKEYTYYDDIDENLCNSVIEFYSIYTTKYNLIFHKNDNQNTSKSIILIKELLIYNVSIYLLLNFYFIEENTNIIKGIHKCNNKNTVKFDRNTLKLTYNEDTTKYICSTNSNLISDNLSYINFYNLMSHNDNGLFLYTNETCEIYYLRSFRYTFLFIMKSNKIYITIDGIEYLVKWYNDEDNYNMYGILKLYEIKNNIIADIDSKIICIYNYDIIIESINSENRHKIKNYIDNNFKSLDTDIFKDLNDLPDEYKVYSYTVLNKYNDKYILINISDVLALLINCLYYNSPFLILKNIEQIKIILNNNTNTNLNKLLNTLFLNFDNIYSLPILFLFYEKEKNIGNFYYKSSNIIYKKYNILLNLDIIDTSEANFEYSKITVNYKDDDITEFIPIDDYEKAFLYFFVKIQGLSIGRVVSDLIVKLNVKVDSNKYNELIISNTNIYTGFNICTLLTENKMNTTSENNFKDLVKIFCLKLNVTCFNANILKATELYNYLITLDKKFIHPIQEIIMGSGKSTVLTSYICILLLTNFLSSQQYFTEKEIYIVMPTSLINASFETLMKFVFPLFNNIEVLIYPNKPLYTNSYHLYLIDDTNYKIMFLTDHPRNIDNKYMIYDEVDMMANPLTCELNSPSTSADLPFEELFDIAKRLYNNIFGDNSTFWIDIKEKNKIDGHYFIYNINAENTIIIHDKFNKIFVTSNPVIDYIRDNILMFILTKQFNLDYGMPENYNLDVTNIYKFKAIPYSAVNSPIMGSEFSDPILTYILTLFCYKFVKCKYRKIDKDYILEYYDNLYLQNKNDKNICLLLKNLFINENMEFEYTNYKKYKEYYMTIYTDTFNITKDFDIIIKKILEMNNTYYKKCKNISFNDLLLSRNVKNFICFTGTAYIEPPQGSLEDINFEKVTKPNDTDNSTYRYITYYENKEKTVLQSLNYIIMNRKIMINMYNNKISKLLIPNIFNCIEKYDVLIDIGGVFTNYNISKFIETYKTAIEMHKKTNLNYIKKKYIVYFDNGRKIQNLETDQFETDKSIIQTEKEVFFFFSNKDITGVDVKNIMNSTVHALVVITNKTNMRDFSQGIFRMRRLLEPKHETFDIVFDDKFYNIINPSKTSYIQTESINCFYKLEDTYNHTIRHNIIKNLQTQQTEITEQKKLSLLKQNIFALTRATDTYNEIYLFLYPTSNEYDKIYNNEKYSKYKDILNIDIINILSIDDIKKQNNTISGLIRQYFILLTKLSKNIINFKTNTNTNSEIETSVEKDTEMLTTTVTQTSNIQMYLVQKDTNKGNISLNFAYSENNKSSDNNILFLHKIGNDSILADLNPHDISDILLVYNHINNNLIILSTYQLIIFLTNNNDIRNYTFISLNDLSIYGRRINKNKKIILLSEVLNILQNNISSKISDGYYSTKNKAKLDKLILYLTISIKYNKEDKSKDESEDESEDERETQLTLKYSSQYLTKNYLTKYIKYKNKYLNLIKNNS